MGSNYIENFERCCRLCAVEQDVTIMIFSEEAEAMLLQNKLNKYLLIEVDEDDRLPKNICIRCCTTLQTVCEFIDTARKAQELLLKRSIILDDIKPEPSSPFNNLELDMSGSYSEDENKYTQMEISVDPMMVLQNSEETMSPGSFENCHTNSEDVTHLHGVDSDDVTIKLIRKGDSDANEDSETKIKPFPCVVCSRGFYSELALKNHSWTHSKEEKKAEEKYKCGTCNEFYSHKNELIVHLRQHRNEGLCKLCGRVFKSEANLAAHMAAHMMETKSYSCKVCGRSYNTRSNLKTHSITHSNERPFHCHLCKKSFKRNQDLKFHINQHTGAKPYQCPFCDKSFASSGNCYSHRSRMHPDRHVETMTKRRVALSRDNKINTNPQPRLIVPKVPLTTVKGIFKYKCSLCEHSFMKRDNYTYHMFQHTGVKPFKCMFCPEEFVTRKGLLLHHNKAHPGMDRPLALLSKNALLK